MYRLGLRLGLGTGMGFISFFFFSSALKSDVALWCKCDIIRRDPGPTSLVGNVTGHENNKTHAVYGAAMKGCV